MLFGLVVQAQELEKRPVAEIIGDFTNLNQAFTIVNEVDHTTAIFLEDQGQVFGVLYDKNFNKLSEVSAPTLPSKYKNIISYAYDGQVFNLYLNTKNNRSYGLLQFDFKSRKAFEKELDFKFKEERFITAINRKNTMFLLSVPVDSDLLNVYSFDGETISHKEINLSEIRFLDWKNRDVNLYDFITDAGILKNKVAATEILDDLPQIAKESSKHVKYYLKSENLFLAFDKHDTYTYLLKLDLDNLNITHQVFTQPYTGDATISVRSGSTLVDSLLFQFKVSPDMLKIQATDINTKEILRTVEIKDSEESIDTQFWNPKSTTEIKSILGISLFDLNTEKPKTFLRFLANSDTGLSVAKIKKKYLITLSAIKEQGGAPLELGYSSKISFGTFPGFNTYNTSRYISISRIRTKNLVSVWNMEMKPVDWDAKYDVIDSLGAFSQDHKEAKAVTNFKKGDLYYWGGYLPSTGRFSIFEFK